MPEEEMTYRDSVNERMKHFEDDMRQSLQRIELSQSLIDVKVTYTNGKVRKIVIGLTLLAGVVIGNALTGKEIITALIAHL